MDLFTKEHLPTSEEYLPTFGEIFTEIWTNIYHHPCGEWFPTKDCSVFETLATTYLSTSLQIWTFTDIALRTTAVGSIKRLLIQTILYLKNTQISRSTLSYILYRFQNTAQPNTTR
jgi:hypothetical protein